jgi:hypothetical protein
MIAYESEYVSLNTIKNWFERFYNENMCLENKHRSGRSINQKSIKVVQQCIEDFPNILACTILKYSIFLKQQFFEFSQCHHVKQSELQLDSSFTNKQSKMNENQYDNRSYWTFELWAKNCI